MKPHRFLLALAGLWSLGTLPAQAQTGCMMDDVLRCWHLTGSYGETSPKRVINMMRSLDPQDAPQTAIRRIELLQAIEDLSFDQRYVIWKLQIDCERQMFMVDSTLVGHADGTVKPKANETTGWVELAKGRYGEAAAGFMACPPPREHNREYRDLLYKTIITDAYRAADAVDWLRKALWSKPGEFVVEK